MFLPCLSTLPNISIATFTAVLEYSVNDDVSGIRRISISMERSFHNNLNIYKMSQQTNIL